jgi:hypothetical protein
MHYSNSGALSPERRKFLQGCQRHLSPHAPRSPLPGYSRFLKGIYGRHLGLLLLSAACSSSWTCAVLMRTCPSSCASSNITGSSRSHSSPVPNICA